MKKRRIIAGVSVMLGLIVLLCVTLMFAKYKMNLGKQREITSQNFYFSSNFLKSDEEPVYEIYGNTVTFEVRNFIDSLRINTTDISYTVTADGCTIDTSSGTLTGGNASSQNITLSYGFPENEDRKEITVTVTGKGKDTKYTKELKAKFILIKPVNLSYEIKDKAGRDYAELYIYMGNTAQDVTIKWDKAKLLIDETNDYVFGKLNSNKNAAENVNIAADTTVKIVFFKKDINQNYEKPLTESGVTIDMPTA